MNRMYSGLSPETSLAEWFDQVEAPLSESFNDIQRAEQRALEITLLNQSCTRRIAAALAGLEPGGAIAAFLERERERLKLERERLNALLALLSERVEKSSKAAGSFVEDSKRLCAEVRHLLERAGEMTLRLKGLQGAGHQLENALTNANNRVEVTEDSLRAITRKSRETAI
jgi:chromosome segregation ATPase